MKFLVALKHLFIPHHGNDYKPHFFRELSVAIVLFGSTFLLGASFGSSFFIHKTVLGVSIAANVLVDMTNDSRIAYNELPLVRNAKLDQAAMLKGNDMVNEGYFAHESPKGVTPWHWFKEVGYTFLYAGENLAVNFTDSKDVQDAWLASPLHRQNILNLKFHEIGLATVEGVYKNNPTIFVVQMFGTPAVAAVPKIEVVKSSTSTNEKAISTQLVVKPAVVTSGIQASSSLALAMASGEVKGEASLPVPMYQPVITTKELVVVKNIENVEPIQLVDVSPQAEKYSTWYQRVLFGGPAYIDIIFKVLILLIALALVTMILVEVRKQHYKHILYGVIMLVVLTVFVYINRGFF
ncbi:MAG: CAP domain-containing protein [Candidatus Paceibacterota bacterium]